MHAAVGGAGLKLDRSVSCFSKQLRGEEGGEGGVTGRGVWADMSES